MKRILILNGHPSKESFNYALANAYLTGSTKNNYQTELLHLADLTFNPILENGFSKPMDWEEDLKIAFEKIKQADHLIWVFPLWWGGFPAHMKGFIDRTFLPGKAFKYHKNENFPEQLLKGKTARIIMTSDTPKWYYQLFMRSAASHQLQKAILEFCGIKPVQLSYFAILKKSTAEQREKWLKEIELMGFKGI